MRKYLYAREMLNARARHTKTRLPSKLPIQRENTFLSLSLSHQPILCIGIRRLFNSPSPQISFLVNFRVRPSRNFEFRFFFSFNSRKERERERAKKKIKENCVRREMRIKIHSVSSTVLES